MRPSPARTMAPEPDLWIPIESLETLPELEDLLDPRYLVDSGQTRAIKVDETGQGFVFVDHELAKPLRYEQAEKRELSHKRWVSKRRTLTLQRKNKVLKIFLILALVLAAMAIAVTQLSQETSPKNTSGKSQFAHAFIPTAIPVVFEGQKTSVLSVADNMDEFLQHNSWTGMDVSQNRFNRIEYETKRSLPAIDVRYPKVFVLNADQKSAVILSSEVSVGDALSTNGIIVDGDDVVTPSKETALKGVETISVVRVSTQTRTASISVPFKVEKQNDPSLLKGKTVVKRAGSNGSADVTYTQTVQNGAVVSEVESSRVVTKNPVNQIVSVGTKNPQTQSGKATFYSTNSSTCAHRTLPMGTMVTVTNNATGASVTCRVADRGPFGEGRIIDLSKEGFAKIAPLSQGIVSVTLSW